MLNFKIIRCLASIIIGSVSVLFGTTPKTEDPLYCVSKHQFFSHKNHTTTYIPEYLWVLGFGIASDVTPFKNGLPANYVTAPPHESIFPKKYIKSIENGDVVWVQSALLATFYFDVLPYITNKFILIVNDGDESFPSSQSQKFDINQFINDEHIIHVFAQNVDYVHSKVTHLPIGIDFHSITRSSGYFGEPHMSLKEQASQLSKLLTKLTPTNERKKKAYVDFQFADRGTFDGESRTSIFNKIIKSGVIDAAPKYLSRHVLWKKRGNMLFQ